MLADKKGNIVALTEDEIRDKIMEYFYSIYENRSGTFRGRERGDKSVQDIANEFSISDRSAISRNIEYLVKSEFITHVIDEHPTAHFPDIKLERHSYEISIHGINKIEGESKYMKNSYNGINISNVGGVVVLGDENIVNQSYQELSPLLTELSETIRNEDIDDSVKLDVIADIETIQQQIKKPSPNKNILTAAWESVKSIDFDKGLKMGGQIVGLVTKITALMAKLCT